MIQNPVRLLLIALLGAIVLIGCGSEPTVTEASGTEASGTDEPADEPTCEDRLDTLTDQLKVDAAYDYEPSDTPAELAATVDAVVSATLGEFSQEGENVSVMLNDLEVISGDTSRGQDGALAISWYVSPEPRDLGDGDGISVLAFLWYEADMPQPAIEGLWFACGLDAPARSMIVEPVEPGWPAGIDATLTNLANLALLPGD